MFSQKKNNINKQKLINDFLLSLRRNEISILKGNTEISIALINYCNQLSELFSKLCESNISASIKVLLNSSEGINSEIVTLARDSYSKNSREPYKVNYKSFVLDNTAFTTIINQILKGGDSYYQNNDLAKERSYQNSSFKFYGKPEGNWTLPYLSELVIPIYGESTNQILGFLSLDSDKKNSFEIETHLLILQFCSDYVVKVIERMKEVDNKIEDEIVILAKEEQMKKQIFISHSSSDKPFVRELNKDLESNNFLTWLDEKDLNIGDVVTDRISYGIGNSDYFLIILSPNSIKSKWVKFEIDEAYNEYVQNKKKILPILIGNLNNEEIPLILKKHLFGDFRTNYHEAFEKLLRSLNK